MKNQRQDIMESDYSLFVAGINKSHYSFKALKTLGDNNDERREYLILVECKVHNIWRSGESYLNLEENTLSPLICYIADPSFEFYSLATLLLL
jgi:hypothetical protein